MHSKRFSATLIYSHSLTLLNRRHWPVGVAVKLRQLVYFHEVIRQDFNISAAAKALFTSQPGMSRQLQDLAEELGVDLFRYQGKRLVGLTEPGQEIADLAANVLRDVKRIRQVADAHVAGQRGGLLIVATRHVADNRLRQAMIALRRRLPTLTVRVCEEDPIAATNMLIAGEADLGVLSEPPERRPELLYLPVEEWRLILVAPQDHDICQRPEVRLEDLAAEPLCSYERTATSRQIIDEAFRGHGIDSPVTFALSSSAMILEYVENGAGIGVIGESAFDASAHPTLRQVAATHLFRPLTTDVVLPRKAKLHHFIYRFVRLLAPSITRAMIEEAR